jgi:hypothetical protein
VSTDSQTIPSFERVLDPRKSKEELQLVHGFKVSEDVQLAERRHQHRQSHVHASVDFRVRSFDGENAKDFKRNLTQFLFKIVNIFQSFGLVHTLLRPKDQTVFDLLVNGVGFVYHLYLQIVAVWSGSRTTTEAQRTVVIFSKSSHNFDTFQKIDFAYLMEQASLKDLNLQNALFKINWRTLVTVRLEQFFKTAKNVFDLNL